MLGSDTRNLVWTTLLLFLNNAVRDSLRTKKSSNSQTGSGKRGPLMFFFFVILFLGAFPVHLVGQSPPENPERTETPRSLREKARRILSNDEYQKEMVSPERRTDRRKRRRSERNETRTVNRTGGAPGEVLELFAWGILIVVGVGLLVAVVYRVIVDRDRKDSTGSESQEDELDREDMKSVMKEAEELAMDGSYTAAVRYMLRDAADRISNHRNISLPDSATNLEYLRRLPENSPLKKLVGILVQALDRCYYGGRECREEDFEKCRSAWKKVVSGTGGGST